MKKNYSEFDIKKLPKGKFIIKSCWKSLKEENNRSCIDIARDVYGDFILNGNETIEELKDKIHDCTGCEVKDDVLICLF